MMKALVITIFCTGILTTPLTFASNGNLEVPVAGSIDSGIGTISGWHCTASEIEIVVDQKSYGLAGSGTVRDDTKSVCGHNATGFSLLFNYSDLDEGPHTVEMYADGQLFTKNDFESRKSAGGNFVRGLTKTIQIEGFPESQDGSTLTWVTAKQSFVVTKNTKKQFDKATIIDLFNNPPSRDRNPFARQIYDGNVSNGFWAGSPRIISSSSATFRFEITDNKFVLIRSAGNGMGICRFEGDYTLSGASIDSDGDFSCDYQGLISPTTGEVYPDIVGHYSTKELSITSNGIYSGIISMTILGDSVPTVELQTGM